MFPTKLIFLILVSSLNLERSFCKWQIWDKELEWWHTTTLYQIYPRSFQDSDGDGIGDLKGIQSRLDHFVETGIQSIWLSPIYTSPMVDLGYDIANFKDIASIFGTLDDFKNLVNEAKKRGIHVLMDMVPNHTSDEHPWFEKSIRRIAPYTDYYMWKDGKRLDNGTIVEPNNWLSLFGGSGWTWNDRRKQYFYHQFNVKQPDLNLTNSDVNEELKNAMKFWLDLGVDGFRVDATKHFNEDPEFHDESCLPKYAGNCKIYTEVLHNYTTDWPTTYNVIYDWRKFLDDYAKNASSKHTRIMLTESYSAIDYVMEYFGNKTHEGAHSPFNFLLVGWPNYATNASEYIRMINLWYDNLPAGRWGNWVAGNHDNHRVATRMGDEMVDAFYMIGMLLPGTAVTYQGEELGQPDTKIRPDQFRDPNNNGGGVEDVRDPERGPFLWDDSENAGFSSVKKPWEPINPSFWRLNLEAQKKAKKSHYKIYKQVINLRKTHTIQRGSLKVYEISNWVFAFSRKLPGNETYVVVVNVGSEREVIVLGEHVENLPYNLTVAVSSMNSGYDDGEEINTRISLHGYSKPLILRPKASIVLTTAGQSTSPDQPPTWPPTSAPTSSSNTTSKPKNAASLLTPNKYSLILLLAPIAIFVLLLA